VGADYGFAIEFWPIAIIFSYRTRTIGNRDPSLVRGEIFHFFR